MPGTAVSWNSSGRGCGCRIPAPSRLRRPGPSGNTCMEATLICRRASASATSAMQPGVSSSVDDEGVGVPAKVGGHPVDGGDPDAPAPHRGGGQVQPGGWAPSSARTAVLGWAARSSTGWMLNASPVCSARAQTVGQAGVVRLHAQQPGHDGPVGACGPGRWWQSCRTARCRPGQAPRPKAGGPSRPMRARAGGMAGGGPDHDRTQNVKQAHCVSNLAFHCKFGRLDGPARRKIQFYYTAFAPDVL